MTTDRPATLPAIAPLRFATAEDWETWLRANAETNAGKSAGTNTEKNAKTGAQAGAEAGEAWLRIAKAGAPETSVSYAEAVEVALCHGWIDGQKKTLDAHYWLQRFTPRRPRSLWSKINCGKALALIAAGRMQAGGQAQVDAARADGRWDAAYDGARASAVPPDLQAALSAHPAALAFFASLDGTNRYAVLWRLQTAGTPRTRTNRLARLVDRLARGEKIHA